MRKSVFFYMMLVFLTLTSCSSSKQLSSNDRQYEVVTLGVGNDGTYLIKVTDYFRTTVENIYLDGLKKDAVHCVIYSGIPAGNGSMKQPALMTNDTRIDGNEAALNDFFEQKLYLNYINSVINSSKTIVKIKGSKDYRISVGISVNKDEVYQLDILVENMGRVNYGPELYDYKGITKSVLLGLQEIHGWEMFSIELKDLSKIKYQPIQNKKMPALYKGVLKVEEVADTFIYLEGFTKGNVFINGFNIGRYFNRGPQKSLYVPAPLLNVGDNVIEIFELQSMENAYVEFKDVEDLG